MTKIIKNEAFVNLLKSKMSFNEFENLNEILGISKKMLTILLREPKKMKATCLFKILELANLNIDEIKEYLK